MPARKKVQVGQYKSSNNHVKTATGEIFYFASVEETPAKMHDLIEWLREHKEQENPIVLAASFHYKFIRIHPFDDGNGRLARILMNFILMRAGFPPVVIKTKEKAAYFRALRQADGGNVEAFVAYIGEQLVASLELYWKGAKGESIEELDDVDKEFELFRMELEGVEEIAALTEENYEDIIKEEIAPFLKIVCSKIYKIEKLYKETLCSMQVFTCYECSNVEHFIHQIEGVLLKGKLELLKSDIIMEFKFNDFYKNIYTDKNTNYRFSCRISLEKNHWILNIESIGEQRLIFKYGEYQEGQATRLADSVLTHFMKTLRSKIDNNKQED